MLVVMTLVDFGEVSGVATMDESMLFSAIDPVKST